VLVGTADVRLLEGGASWEGGADCGFSIAGGILFFSGEGVVVMVVVLLSLPSCRGVFLEAFFLPGSVCDLVV